MKIKINGNKKLTGSVYIGGAKNSAVALIPAALLTDEEVTICNIPEISDIDDLVSILDFLEVETDRSSNSIVINSKNMRNKPIEDYFSSKLRASYYFMGALIGRFKRVEISFPGGCAIGKRPIDQHLKGFKCLNCEIIEKDSDTMIIEAKDNLLIGSEIYLDIPSVGATINIMMAATLAEGVTIINNAAREPEIVNVATMLNNMGANIVGAGTNQIKIVGKEKLIKGFVEVIPDRIEAATYILIGALVGENLKVKNIILKHVEPLISKLHEIGADFEIEDDEVKISAKKLKSTEISTAVYPGFPTDMQQIFTVLLSLSKGTSVVKEKIFENRFMQVPYLNEMGANISINGNTIYINGVDKLCGKEVVATDLRAGAALVLAGLVAEGETTIYNAKHILRGYEKIAEKLKDIGAEIEITEK